MRKYYLLFILLSFTSLLASQSLDAVRIEVPTDIDAEAFKVEPIGEDGMLVFYASNEIDNENRRNWYFGLFNTTLKQQWLKFVPLTDNIEFITSRHINNEVFFLFKNMGRDRSGSGYYEIVTYDKRKEKFSKITGSIPEKAEYAGFDIIGNTACLALNLRKFATDLVFINLDNGNLNPVSIDEGTPGFIHSVYADRKNRRFYTVMKQNRDRRYVSEQLLCHDIRGNEIFNKKIENTEPLKYFDDYTFQQSLDGDLLIFGTYSIISGKNLSLKELEEDEEDRSAGMFYLRFNGQQQKEIRYYDFMKFSNITRAIGPDNIVKTKTSDDSLNDGRSTVAASFNLINPQVYINPSGLYIFSVEVYQPYYKTETRMDYDFYGRPYPYTYNVFHGYDFYDVIVAGLDDDGNIVWSNDFPIYDMLTYSLSRKSMVFSDKDIITLAYINEGKIITQTIDGPSDLDRSMVKIATDFSKDKVTEEENSHIIRWYDDYFLIYGYQQLRNRSLGDKAYRSVFYANKIAYK